VKQSTKKPVEVRGVMSHVLALPLRWESVAGADLEWLAPQGWTRPLARGQVPRTEVTAT